jgi:anti-sigma factor RsiW
MNQHLSDLLLLRGLDGELSRSSREAIEHHLSLCPACVARWDRLRTVSAALENYSAALTDPQPADRQRAALLAAVHPPLCDVGTPPCRVETRLDPWRFRNAVILATAAAVLLAVGLSFPRKPPAAIPSLPPAAITDAFIALPYSDENLSPEGAVVLQVEVPRSALLLAGLPAAGCGAGDRVKAEVVVGADGLARAIRFLN